MSNPIQCSNSRVELEQKFKEELKNAGKSAAPELINDAIRVFLKTKVIDWSHRHLQGWSEWGFSYLYIVTESMNAELELLLVLVEIDKQIGWYLESSIELFIFRFKALKIIDNGNV